MITSARKLKYVLIGLVFLLAGLFTFSEYITCRFSDDSFDHVYACYSAHISELSKKEGVASALVYVKEVVYPHNGYSTVHILLHHLGEAAYEENDDPSSINAYLSPHADFFKNDQFLNGFDGFVHGYLAEYITSQEKPLPTVMRDICEGSLKISHITTDTYACYHTLGHALMHAVGNRTSIALSLCDTAPEGLAQSACYVGAFMEDTFLYDPHYHENSPRPDVSGPSLLTLCSDFVGVKAEKCAQQVGDSYLTMHHTDAKGAFIECEKLPQNKDICVQELGTIIMASFSQNKEDVATLCKKYAQESQINVCENAALSGLHTGFGVHPHQSFSDRFSSFLYSLTLLKLYVPLPLQTHRTLNL